MQPSDRCHKPTAMPILDRQALRPRGPLRAGRVLAAGREAGAEGGATAWGWVEKSV